MRTEIEGKKYAEVIAKCNARLVKEGKKAGIFSLRGSRVYRVGSDCYNKTGVHAYALADADAGLRDKVATEEEKTQA